MMSINVPLPLPGGPAPVPEADPEDVRRYGPAAMIMMARLRPDQGMHFADAVRAVKIIHEAFGDAR